MELCAIDRPSEAKGLIPCRGIGRKPGGTGW